QYIISSFHHAQNHLYFQHDNNPKYTSYLIRNYLRHKEINVFSWPAKSPDLSPIESCWAILKRQLQLLLYYKDIVNNDGLFDALKEVWYSKEFCQVAIKCYNTFPKCLRMLKDNNYCWIKY
ncbi:hypothetical protein CYLTODRAFT_363256, partial [Cylindrobasidium torrendii FP15055 ss-10]